MISRVNTGDGLFLESTKVTYKDALKTVKDRSIFDKRHTDNVIVKKKLTNPDFLSSRYVDLSFHVEWKENSNNIF